RFLVRLSLGHLTPEVESQLIQTRRGDPLAQLQPVATAEDLEALQLAADQVRVDPAVADYAVRLAGATRNHAEIERGVSTRAVLALMAAARAFALWDARDFATPGDIRSLLVPTLSHRLLLKSALQGTFSREEAGLLLEEIARKTPAPR